MLLRVTPKDADHLGLILEQGIRAAHEATCEAENAQDRDDAAETLAAARRLLRELEPDSVFLGANIQVGVPFYWDEWLEDLDSNGQDDSVVVDANEQEHTAPTRA